MNADSKAKDYFTQLKYNLKTLCDLYDIQNDYGKNNDCLPYKNKNKNNYFQIVKLGMAKMGKEIQYKYKEVSKDQVKALYESNQFLERMFLFYGFPFEYHEINEKMCWDLLNLMEHFDIVRSKVRSKCKFEACKKRNDMWRNKWSDCGFRHQIKQIFNEYRKKAEDQHWEETDKDARRMCKNIISDLENRPIVLSDCVKTDLGYKWKNIEMMTHTTYSECYRVVEEQICDITYNWGFMRKHPEHFYDIVPETMECYDNMVKKILDVDWVNTNKINSHHTEYMNKQFEEWMNVISAYILVASVL